MKFEKIALASVELEGNWFEKPKYDLVPDGSIKSEHFKRPKYVGELVSKPFDSPDELFSFIKDNYPDEVNHKSGLHSHLSFRTVGLYSQLMRKEFYNYFIESMEKWAKHNHITNPLFWKRFNGEMPDYCAKKFHPEDQLQAKTKEEARPYRATFLNYCWNQHKTLENRLACAFLCSETAISYLTAYFECVESYLEESNLKEKPFKVQLIESEEIEDEDNVRVKPFKLKLPPFNLFAPDFIYKKNKFQYKNKERKLDEMDFSLSDGAWEELLQPRPYQEIF